MNKSNDEILKEFLETASEDDCLRAIRFEFDAIPSFKGWLPIHLTFRGATKECLLNSYDLVNQGVELCNTNLELRKIALERFREELKMK